MIARKKGKCEMKGFGAFFVLIFLFFCFVWGIGSVVAGIRSLFGNSGRVSVRPESNGKRSDASEASNDDAFESIRKAGELHHSGVLSDEEFSKLKEKLINKM